MPAKLIKDLTAASGAELSRASYLAGQSTSGGEARKFSVEQVGDLLKVNTIAALKALAVPATNNTSVSVLGYYSAGDGGGGEFYWDSASSATANGGTILAADAGGTGRWRRAYSGSPNAKWFGAKGDGTTNDTAAFTAFETATSGQVIDLGGGAYVVNSIPTGNDYYNGSFNGTAQSLSYSAIADAAATQAEADAGTATNKFMTPKLVARAAVLFGGGVSNAPLFATTTKALSKGVASTASLVGGSGGTNGTFDLAFSGGAGSGAAGVFVVAGGALVSIEITASGDSYTSAPTISFAASSGLTGASATAVIANNVDPGEYFSVPSSGGYLAVYQNVAGVATLASNVPLPALAGAASGADALTTSNGTVTSEYDRALAVTKTVIRPKVLLDVFDQTSPNGATEADAFNGYVCASWINGNAGFVRDGFLRSVRIPSTTTATAGSKVQAWVLRPRTTLAGAATYTFDVVAQIGEVTAEPTANHRSFEGLAIPVQAGDIIAIRPIGAGIAFGTASSPTYDNDVFITQTLAGTSLSDMTDGFSAVADATTKRRFFLYAEITSGPNLVANGPNTPIVRDTLGNIPQETVRLHDGYWKGKNIGAVGTSITVGADATGDNGYINQLGPMLQCIIDNQGVGSSAISWDGAQDLSLSATQAELTAAGRSPTYSYEAKMIGKNKDLWIFDHGYNDRDAPLGTINSTDKSTFYGAYNVVIAALLADKPSQRFMFLTPFSLYSPSNVLDSGTVAVRTALLALADKYKAPILDFSSLLQINATQVTTFIPSQPHPTQAAHDIAARLLYNFIKGL